MNRHCHLLGRPLLGFSLLGLSACTILEVPNTASPSVTILAPFDSAVFEESDEIVLVAEVSDGGDPLVLVAVEMVSDIDGSLCTRAPGQTGLVQCELTLSSGIHTLEVTASDPYGGTDLASISFTVNGGDDNDADGWTVAEGDCDDNDASLNPGVDEIADGVDNDCDGDIDEDTILSDDDFDGYTEDEGDCDDGDPGAYPDAEELADGIDNDCDGVIDEGTEAYDDDGDGYNELGGDCDDEDPELSPGAVEVADGIDNDCDGDIDEPDAAYSGSLIVVVSGDDGGNCTGTAALLVDSSAVPEAAGAATCLTGLFEDVSMAGRLTSDSEVVIAMSALALGEYDFATTATLTLTGDTLSGPFTGSFSDDTGTSRAVTGSLSMDR